MAPTSDTTVDGDLVYRYTQGDATLYGLEGTLEVLATRWLKLHGAYDYIRGKQSNGSNLPFIPQNKLKLGLRIFNDHLGPVVEPYFRADYTLAFDQDLPAPFETSTGGYHLFDLGAGITVPVANQRITIELVVSNLFNATYIDHLSTLKSLGYYNAGRNIMVNLRVPFGLKRVR